MPVVAMKEGKQPATRRSVASFMQQTTVDNITSATPPIGGKKKRKKKPKGKGGASQPYPLRETAGDYDDDDDELPCLDRMEQLNTASRTTSRTTYSGEWKSMSVSPRQKGWEQTMSTLSPMLAELGLSGDIPNGDVESFFTSGGRGVAQHCHTDEGDYGYVEDGVESKENEGDGDGGTLDGETYVVTPEKKSKKRNKKKKAGREERTRNGNGNGSDYGYGYGYHVQLQVEYECSVPSPIPPAQHRSARQDIGTPPAVRGVVTSSVTPPHQPQTTTTTTTTTMPAPRSANPPPSARAAGKQPMPYSTTTTTTTTTTTNASGNPPRSARAAAKAPAPPHNYAQHHAHHHTSPPSSNASAPQKHRPPGGTTQNSTNAKSNNKIWSTNTTEERERIKEFWLGLSEEERRALVKVEKEAVLRKMKEQQKHSCSCAVCGRKRSVLSFPFSYLVSIFFLSAFM